MAVWVGVAVNVVVVVGVWVLVWVGVCVGVWVPVLVGVTINAATGSRAYIRGGSNGFLVEGRYNSAGSGDIIVFKDNFGISDRNVNSDNRSFNSLIGISRTSSHLLRISKTSII